MTKVLHIDDESTLLAKVREILAPHFECASSGEPEDPMLDVVESVRPDVLLLDISLPRRNGFELARELSRTCPGIKIVFLTVHSEAEYVREAFRIGARGYVLKSSIGSDLVDAISEVVRGGTFASAGLPPVVRPLS